MNNIARYQLFIQGVEGRAWVNLKPQAIIKGQLVRTQLRPDGSLQYIRRTGVFGVSAEQYLGGEPQPGQWRVHPAAEAPRPVFVKAGN